MPDSLWQSAVFRRGLAPYFGTYLVCVFPVLVLQGIYSRPSLFQMFVELMVAWPTLVWLAWIVGPARRFYRRLSQEDFCASCGRSFEVKQEDKSCPACRFDVAESIRILNVGRDSPLYTYMVKVGFGWRSIIAPIALWTDRIDTRMRIPYLAIALVGQLALMYGDSRDWLPDSIGPILVLGFILGPFLAYRMGPVHRFLRRLKKEDFCMYCEYSLQGHSAEGVCPECGRSISASLRILERHRDATRNATWWERIFI